MNQFYALNSPVFFTYGDDVEYQVGFCTVVWQKPSELILGGLIRFVDKELEKELIDELKLKPCLELEEANFYPILIQVELMDEDGSKAMDMLKQGKLNKFWREIEKFPSLVNYYVDDEQVNKIIETIKDVDLEQINQTLEALKKFSNKREELQ